MIRRWFAHVAWLALLGLSGCPATLDDNFTVVPHAASGDAGAATPPEGGAPDLGGAPATSGGAGTPSGGTVAGQQPMGGEPSGAGSAGGPSLGACAGCTAAECCDGVCVDLAFDSKNCRACGKGCPGTTCDRGSCTNTCALGFIDCNHNVVDGCEVNAAVDPANCGNCGIVCGFQLECVGGNCVCPTGTADCDGVKDNGCETVTSSNPSSCGGCGKACAAGQRCLDGACGCQAGFADCNASSGDGCEASLDADRTCGSCGLDCGPHGKCVTPGSCGCMPGYIDCDKDVAGCETPITDPAHCGSCSSVCPAQASVCDGTTCSAGCGALTRCGSSCVDTATDLQNCGGCGKAVGSGQTCVAGKPVCLAGHADCDGNPGDCEANTDVDVGHCGSCGVTCKPGALCSAGVCACAPNTPKDCGASCQQCCSDGQCSDGDSCTADVCDAGSCKSSAPCAGGGLCCAGTGCFECCGDLDCASGQTCSAHQCVVVTCPAPKLVCSGQCIDPTTDSDNCGSCDNRCGVGRSCSGSACTPNWVKTAEPPVGFGLRERASYTNMGGRVFIWGGVTADGTYLADGAVYDPDTDTWATLGTAGTPPTARAGAVAVWTGSVVVVWGGGTANSDLTSGSRFDPATGKWTAITSSSAPAGRRGSFGFWTGSRVLIWGGFDRNGTAYATGSLYDPVNDRWSTMSTANGPSARTDPTVGWSGSQLLIYGGNVGGSYSARTYRYDPAKNSWGQGADGPSARSGAFGTWDGSFLSAWGGTAPLKNDGKLYEPSSDKWSTMSNNAQPMSRYAPTRQTGWSARVKPGVTLMLGGLGAMTSMFFVDGALFNSTTNAWTPVPSWPSGYSHLYGVAVWSGSEFVLWGGRTATGTTLTAVGERYRP